MFATATLLSSLDAISAETVTMLTVLDEAKMTSDRREAKRRVLEIKGKAQELFEWLTAVGLEETPPLRNYVGSPRSNVVAIEPGTVVRSFALLRPPSRTREHTGRVPELQNVVGRPHEETRVPC
jgi:hypothetical protein